ncbi:hypothetical protein PT974_12194 [Cladobotryum mycophilum]|uniref:PNPLA domain-containing protein n=1 Tax=Cladobotryum mycophilum TaxID=491253 RepID=A0ABR0S7B6_9HYPO
MAAAAWQKLRLPEMGSVHERTGNIKGIGYVQDGGLTHNNPVVIAIQEAAALFPLTPRSSLVVSLSTRSSKQGKPQLRVSNTLLEHSSVARLAQLLLTQNEKESDQACKKALDHQKIGESGEFFRFNVEFNGKEPSLDNVTDLDYLGQIARDSIHKSPDVIRLAHCIRAELFILELAQRPRLINGVYECVGYIICRLPQDTPGFKTLMDRLNKKSATFGIGAECLINNLQDQFSVGEQLHYRRMIKFHVSGRQVPFSITLREGPVGDCHISGSPFTLDWLINAQQLDACFGLAEHQNVTVPQCYVEHGKRKMVDESGKKHKRQRQ